VQQEALVRYLEETSNYKTTIEGSGIFVFVAGVGEEKPEAVGHKAH
jgi:hypothetical protein